MALLSRPPRAFACGRGSSLAVVGGLFGVGPGQQEYEFPVVPVDLPLRAEVADYPTDFAAMSEAMEVPRSSSGGAAGTSSGAGASDAGMVSPRHVRQVTVFAFESQ